LFIGIVAVLFSFYDLMHVYEARDMTWTKEKPLPQNCGESMCEENK